MAANTTPQRRQLRFETIDAALAEVDRLVAAERDGRLQRCGTWTLGQALGHVATWANFPFDGYPNSVRAPLPVRMILRLMRNKVLNSGMMAGVKIRGISGGTLGLDVLSTEEGLLRYRAAMERLRNTSPTIPNPVFGPLTHEQWIQLNLRHAELHLSFHSVANDLQGEHEFVNIDFRQDAADLQAFIVKTLSDYGDAPSSDRGTHDSITRIGLWFWLGDGGPGEPYVAIQLDTRPDAEPDGEWTFEHFAMLERPHWSEPLDALSNVVDGVVIPGRGDPSDVSVTFSDGSTRKVRSAETDQLFGDFCVAVLKSTAAAGLLSSPHIAPGCEMDVECDDFHFGWPDYDDRGLENMANPAENGRRRTPTPPRPDAERAQDDARLYDVWLLVPPGKDRKAAIAEVGATLGIGVAAARDLIDTGRILAELVDAREVIRLGKLLRPRGLDIKVEPPFRWPIA